MTLVASPEGVFAASAGGAATSGGAGIVVCADAVAAASVISRAAKMRMGSIVPVLSCPPYLAVLQLSPFKAQLSASVSLETCQLRVDGDPTYALVLAEFVDVGISEHTRKVCQCLISRSS